MSRVKALAPGVYQDGQKLTLCPACGLKFWGRDWMDREEVFIWLVAVLSVLKTKGVRGANPEDADRMADKWVAGDHRTHQEGGHDVEAN